MPLPPRAFSNPIVARARLDAEGLFNAHGAVLHSGIAVVTLSSNQSDYALPDDCSALLIDCDTAAVSINGMQGGAQGREVVFALRQTSDHSLSLVARTGPTTANWFATDVDTVLAPGEGATFRWMDPGTGNPGWRLIGLGKVPGSLAGYATEAYVDSAVAAVALRTIEFEIALGAGVSLVSGSKQRVLPGMPYGLELYAWRVRAQDASGSIEFDVRRRADDTAPTSGDSICGSGNEPYLSAEWGRYETDLSAWTSTTLAAGDRIAVNVDYSSIVGLRDATLMLYGVQL